VISRRDQVIGYLFLSIAALAALLPFAGVIILALGKPGQISPSLDISQATHFGNFGDVWNVANFGASMKASTIITVTIMVVSVALSVPAGYALALAHFPGRSSIFFLFVFGLLIPLEAMIIPLYFDMRKFGLADNYWSVILPDIGFSVAFGAFWMRAFFMGVDRSLVEAARLDGANSWQTLLKILLPLARPQLLTLAVLFFVWNWNDFLLPLVMLAGSEIQTAPISLVYFQGQHTTDFTYLAAGALITIAPVVVIYVLLQRSFTRGVLAGAVKD
jgi:raffinose/stachyose/melibiose transport system permease protein